MDPQPERSPSRRRVLRWSAGAAGTVAAATLLPFAGQVLIHRKTTENGEIVELDLSSLPPGEMITVDWLGKPVWIVHRTPEMIERLARGPGADLVDPESAHARQPAYVQNVYRSLRPAFFVAVGLCTHLGCTPNPRFKPGGDEGMPEHWRGGFLCPCHTSTFDLAGRVHRNREAKENLAIPPHAFLADGRLRIGEDPDEAR